MSKQHAAPPSSRTTASLVAATERIAPVWPLDGFVAVNPYLGMLEQDVSSVARRLQQVAGARSTMPTRFYLEAIEAGDITEEDLAQALDGRSTVADFLRTVRDSSSDEPAPRASVPTVADVAAERTGSDWVRFATDRISAWASAYFDEGQAAWAPVEASVYASWRAEAELDRTPELMGLPDFRAHVRDLPSNPLAAAELALQRLDVPASRLELYLHRLLMRVGGWAAFARRRVWDEKLYRQAEDDTLIQFLAVLLSWEVAMLNALSESDLASAWARAQASEPSSVDWDDLDRRLILQRAHEGAVQRRWIASFEGPRSTSSTPEARRPRAQAIFCIDVRSEVYRRHLEAAASDVDTLGFAGFFAFPVEFVPLAHQKGLAQCPVLLTPAARIEEELSDADEEQRAVKRRRLHHEVGRIWKGFKMGAVSCFSFVGPLGLAYLPKLFTDGFGWTRPVDHPDQQGLSKDAARTKGVRLEPGEGTGLTLDQRVALAQGALKAMSLTSNFGRLVLIAGHGSSTVNNPHATGLDCGACAGHTGEANVRVAAATLNQPEVRSRLAEGGLEIPEDTFFLACQHDTTTDEVTIFNRREVPSTHAEDLAWIEDALHRAGRSCRQERGRRLGSTSGEAVLSRSRDWAQVRPEWGLAGCSAFVVAPRHRTRGATLDGRAFLHSYDWKADEDFSILELIMTAPMVVASWINLQYYASTVDNRLFGCGDKTLHNVVGTVGVLEGNGGDLRVGLPWQSVHDGERLQHEPVRLSVVIEAPLEAMNKIIDKHEDVRRLVDNGWLSLFQLDETGRVRQRYAGGLQWETLDPAAAAEVSAA